MGLPEGSQQGHPNICVKEEMVHYTPSKMVAFYLASFSKPCQGYPLIKRHTHTYTHTFGQYQISQSRRCPRASSAAPKFRKRSTSSGVRSGSGASSCSTPKPRATKAWGFHGMRNIQVENPYGGAPFGFPLPLLKRNTQNRATVHSVHVKCGHVCRMKRCIAYMSSERFEWLQASTPLTKEVGQQIPHPGATPAFGPTWPPEVSNS